MNEEEGKVQVYYAAEGNGSVTLVDTYTGKSLGYNVDPGSHFIRVWSDSETALYQAHRVRKIVVKRP